MTQTTQNFLNKNVSFEFMISGGEMNASVRYLWWCGSKVQNDQLYPTSFLLQICSSSSNDTKKSSSDLSSVATTCVVFCVLVGGPTASHTRSVTKTIQFLSNWHLLMSSVSLSISISPPTESAHTSLSKCLLLATHNQLGQMRDIGVISYVRNVKKLL